LRQKLAHRAGDGRTEFLVKDRLSFKRFLGLSLSGRVPDARTMWLFREKLTKAEAIKPLFERFEAAPRGAISRWAAKSWTPG
jgi:IS5 family transposase